MLNDRRYALVACSFLIQGLMIGGLFAYGVIFTALEEEFGWSRTLISGCVSLSFLVMGIGAIGAGYLNDRIGPRVLMTVAGALYGCGYALIAYLDAPWQLFVLYGLFIGIGLSTHDVVTLGVIGRIFARRRGMMSGVVKVGTATGQMIVPLSVAFLITEAGWRSAVLTFGVVAGVLLVAAGFGLGIKTEPPQPVDKDEASSSTAEPAGVTVQQAFKSRAFWTLCLTQFMFLPTLVTVPIHLPVHAQDLGMSNAAAATLVSLIGGVSIVGRLTVGTSADRIGGRIALLASLVLLGVSLVFLTFATTTWHLYAFCCIYGVAHGGLFTVVAPVIGEYFGMRSHGSLFGIVLFFGTIGASLGPLAAGFLFDQTGTYSAAFWSLAGMAGLGALLVLSLPTSNPGGVKS